MSEWITRNEAREHFEKCGLSYKSIRRYHIDLLRALLGKEFRESRKHPDSNDHVSPGLSDKTKFKRRAGKLAYAFLTMNGDYFKDRECVSFNSGGFIGFAGWASDGNVQPVLRAFVKWCDLIAGDAE